MIRNLSDPLNTRITADRVVDQHGTTTTTSRDGHVVSVRFHPHESLADIFTRVVEHVRSAAPIMGRVPDSVRYHCETLGIFGVTLELSYAAGAGITMTTSGKRGSLTSTRTLHAKDTSVETTRELYSEMLNDYVARAC